MFQRTPNNAAARRSSNQRTSVATPPATGSSVVSYETPLGELTSHLDRLEALVREVRVGYHGLLSDNAVQLLATSPSSPPQGKGISFRSLQMKNKKDSQPTEIPPAPDLHKPPPPPPQPPAEAIFIPMSLGNEEELVELLRRIAEMVVTGERMAAASEGRKKRRERWGKDITEQSDDEDGDDDNSVNDDREKDIALFEHFFERNALSLIVDIVIGAAFKVNYDDPSAAEASDQMDDDSEKGGKRSSPVCTLLPALTIATQALQSVSILVQNFSRATSLYFLLSNNHINKLIYLPLELYAAASQAANQNRDHPIVPRRLSISPEMSEFTTHFITFLKSLALRMNAETLQFFLRYPTEASGGDDALDSKPASSAYFSDSSTDGQAEGSEIPVGPSDETKVNETGYTTPQKLSASEPVVEEMRVDFPLYARALDFCASHHESFVRVTAMNICLNTLRLAAVAPSAAAALLAKGSRDSPLNISTPAGVLHNAKPLPFRERLAIAQHVCTPSRVERLVSPIFTKLAQLWGVLEELIRDMEMLRTTKSTLSSRRFVGANGNGDDETSSPRRFSYPSGQGNPKAINLMKVDRAKEEARQQRLVDRFAEAAANFQDELLLLEDVLKVGLTSLNEQIIEMMLATFVYPLLLQPLLLYVQREVENSKSVSPSEPLPIGGLSPIHRRETVTFHASAPAKTALFSLGAVFHLITNGPLLRLVFTALLHPLAPDATGEIMFRAKPETACFLTDGGLAIRVDKEDETYPGDSGLLPYSRNTYTFGKNTGELSTSQRSMNDSLDSADETCVFVLSPALAEVLEFRGGDVALLARTRPNPYRRAVLTCVATPQHESDFGPLSVAMMDAALSAFDELFIGEILFGSGMKTFEDIPLDEQQSDSKTANDRDMGSVQELSSRRSLPSSSGKLDGAVMSSDTISEALAALCASVMSAVPGVAETWKLEYDDAAGHALLCASRGLSKALQSAATISDRRWRQSAAFISDFPPRIMQLSAPNEPAPDDSIGFVLNRIFYDTVKQGSRALVEVVLQLQREDEKNDYCMLVARKSTFNDMCNRICQVSPDPLQSHVSPDEATLIEMARASARALLQLDALSTLIKDAAATGGGGLRGGKIAGFVFTSGGEKIDTVNFGGMSHTVFSPISRDMTKALFDEEEKTAWPQAGSVVGLVGRTAIPCVCEVPAANASLFADGAPGVVSEGVTWQSLYLVVLGSFMILAEPERGGSAGNGRVVSSCPLEQLSVFEDTNPPAPGGSPARRLLLSHHGFDLKEPPGLFLWEIQPSDEFIGPFVRVQITRSSLDLWFEDLNAANHAYHTIQAKIRKAKSRRGNRLRDLLAAQDLDKKLSL